MTTALTHLEDQVHSAIRKYLEGVEAPVVDTDVCDGSQSSYDPREHAPKVSIGWDEMSLDKSKCDPRFSEVDEWSWYAELRWNCTINTSHYIQSLIKDPLIIPGTTNTRGRKTSPDMVVRLTNVKNTRRPEQGSSKGSLLDLSFSIGRIP